MHYILCVQYLICYLSDYITNLFVFMQFKLAYVAPESRVVGAGELVDHPKKIALNYLTGFFFLDLFIVLPLPQVSFPPCSACLW